MIRCHSTQMRFFITALLDLLPTHTMTTSDLSNDIFLAIESNVSDALARFPMDFERWTGVDRQLKRLSTNQTMEQWLKVQNCMILKTSIEKLTELEKEHHLGDEQKATALKYTARVWEISMIRQMARELTGKNEYELHSELPTFVRILSQPSVIQRVSLSFCDVQDRDFSARRRNVSGLLKKYGELSKIDDPPVPEAELDAELARIQKSSAQLKSLANETFSPVDSPEAGPEKSFDSTNPSGSTAPSGPSLTLTISGSTGSGYDNTVNSANTRENTKKSISGVSAGGPST
jgi:hypothetical protein